MDRRRCLFLRKRQGSRGSALVPLHVALIDKRHARGVLDLTQLWPSSRWTLTRPIPVLRVAEDPGHFGGLAMLTRPRLTAAARLTPAAATRNWRARLTLFLLGAALALFAWGGAAAAAPLGQINEFSAGLNNGRLLQLIAPGADGNLWFTDQGSTPAI